MKGLLEPLEVKGFTITNRIVLPPMNTELATIEGFVTDNLIEYYLRRSKELGMLIIEHSYVSLNGKLSEKQLGIHDNRVVSGLTKLVDRIHAIVTPVVIQINHAGGKASRETTGHQPIAPSPNGNVRELRGEELDAVAEAFAGAAERAVRSGFDGVELHGAHGFLLNQFFSPLTNRRRDEYGGSLENRMRFPLEIVERVKEKIGEKLLLYRLGSVDLVSTGTQIEDSQKFARKLEEGGVDIIDVSGGLCGDEPVQLRDKQGYFIPQAQKIKKIVNVPVIGVGGITDPKYAHNLILKEKVDLVAVGRALLIEPDWAVKAIKTLRTTLN